MDNRKNLITEFWNLFDEKKYEATQKLLHKNFTATWATSNEKFLSAEKMIKVNSDYPGDWSTKLQKIELISENKAVSVVHIFEKNPKEGFFVTTFYEFKDNLIFEMTEYYAEITERPDWRKNYSEII